MSEGLFPNIYCKENALIPATALEMVGLETMTGVTFGALVIAPRCTIPIRPQPITPTLISFGLSPFVLIYVFTDDLPVTSGVVLDFVSTGLIDLFTLLGGKENASTLVVTAKADSMIARLDEYFMISMQNF